MVWLIVFLLLCAMPLGLILSIVTKDEKQIYTKYFYSLEWFLLIATAVFLTINKIYAITCGFLVILIFFWNNADKILYLTKQRLKKVKFLIKR